jgi:hypothetical protein
MEFKEEDLSNNDDSFTLISKVGDIVKTKGKEAINYEFDVSGEDFEV